MQLDIAEINSGISAWRAGADFRDAAGDRQTISFEVYPSESDHIDLKTGEIFRNPRYARLYKTENKSIAASLTCYRQSEMSQEDSARLSRLQYFESSKRKDNFDSRPAKIFMSYILPDAQFDLVRTHILSRARPTSVRLALAEGDLEFGWEPDGSGMKWDNEARPFLPILGIEFSFRLEQPSSDPDEDLSEPYDRESFTDQAKVANAVLSRLTSLRTTAREILWMMLVIAFIVAWQLLNHR